MKARNLLLVILSVVSIGQLYSYKPSVGSGPMAPREWLIHNATHEQKKLIANLQLNNALASLKVETFCFVGHRTPEFKMFTNLPPHVQEYLQKKLSSVCFEDKRCTKDDMAIKVHGLENKKPNAKEIENFISDSYDFLG